MRRVATLFSALTLATLSWTAGTAAHAATPAPSHPAPSAQGASVATEEQRAAVRFWTAERLRTARDVTTLPAARTAKLADPAPTAGERVTVPRSRAPTPPSPRPRRGPRPPPPGPAAA
ncbi:hypothetical protein ACFQ10_23935 [Streptomyces indonesiensis]